MYADTDFWIALMREDDWLAEHAERRLEEYRGELQVSLATFLELFLIEDRFGFDREGATVAILELANADFDADVVFQASAYIDDGATVFDAFHGALAGGRILSSDGVFDELGMDRARLEAEG